MENFRKLELVSRTKKFYPAKKLETRKQQNLQIFFKKNTFPISFILTVFEWLFPQYFMDMQ